MKVSEHEEMEDTLTRQEITQEGVWQDFTERQAVCV